MMKPECKCVRLTEMWPGGKCLGSLRGKHELGCSSSQVIWYNHVICRIMESVDYVHKLSVFYAQC